MKQNLRDRVQEWKKDKTVRKEFRSAKAEKSTIVDGEYTITLKMAVKVKYMAESEDVVATCEVKTMEQSVNDNQLENPQGDVQLFNIFAKQLEKDFDTKFEKTLSKL